MTPARPRQPRVRRSTAPRYTIDASVFVNAFNPHEDGHAASLKFLETVQASGHPVVLPTLALPEVASAIARATDDGAGAVRFAATIPELPNVSMIGLTAAVARQAAELAASHRLRGADAVYLAIARRYGTTLVSRDAVQRARGTAVAPCRSPEDALTSP